jgi:hypothetical protein
LGVTLFVLLYRLFASFSPRKRLLSAMLFTLILMLVAPINLLTLNAHNLYFGYIAPHSYHNPTIILLLPLAFGVFLFALRVFNDKPVSVPWVLVCAGIAALSTIAKPNYAICLLPALALCTLYALVRKQPIDWRLLLVGIVIPTVEVIIWQFFYYRYQGVGGFAFAPFQVMEAFSPGTLLPKLILSILFPALVLILYFKDATRDLAMRLSWLAFLFGAFYTYFLIDSVVWAAGNFGWSGEVTLLILFITSTFFVIRQYQSTRQWTPRLGICAAALVLHLVSGSIFYLPHLTSAWNTWY